MDPLMQLVVGWTLVGGFVFTVVVTCLSLVGWVRFADPAQQRRLFAVLVVELIVGVGGNALGAWRFDAGAVGTDIHAGGRLDGAAATAERILASPQGGSTVRAGVLRAVEQLELPRDSDAARRRSTLIEELRRAPDDDAFRRTLREVPRGRAPLGPSS
ncbi:MAG TPA: hypothetical protein VMT18_03905 [Planctomycetota bacterium]|nr:hypothetical protein [Planctomycetota bacterium]